MSLQLQETIQRGKSITAPIITDNPQDRAHDEIHREMTPSETRMIMAGMDGDLREWGNLTNSMIDSWARLQSNLEEVKTQVSKAPLEVMPHLEDEEPTPQAQERAEFVEKALYNMRSNLLSGEKGLTDLIEDICLGYYTGHTVSEVRWEQNELGVVPRATYPLGWRYFRYPDMSDDIDRLMLCRDGLYYGNLEDFPAHRFLVGIRKSHSGHATVAAPMRAMVQYWMASIYGMKWLLSFSQIYGIPFRFANYADNTDRAQVESMLKKMGANAYAAFPQGVDFDIKESNAAASQLPQKVLMDIADKMADIWILGQTLTTDVADSGSRALGNVHMDVRMDKLQGVADFVSTVINNQLVKSIMLLNYGDLTDVPKVCIEFPRPKDEKGMVERDKVLFNEMKLPIASGYLYERYGLKRPNEDDELYEPPSTSAPLIGNFDSGDDDDPGEDEGVEASQLIKAADGDKATIDKLVDNTLKGLTGVNKEWLRPVRPYFEKLAAMAMSNNVSDQDFVAALQAAQKEMPELFDKINTKALDDSLKNAIGSSMIAGSVARYEDD